MNIRRTSYEDIDPVLNLMHELGYFPEKSAIIENITEYDRSPEYEVFVAEDEDKIVGCISLHVMKLFHMKGNVGRITSIVVPRESRRNGIGKDLINVADRYFRSMGCVKAEVTSADHRKNAHKFYQSVGFVLDERRFIKNYRG